MSERVLADGLHSVPEPHNNKYQEIAMAGGNTLRLKVRPDITADPKVHLDNRDPTVEGGTKLRWEKEKGAEDFDFIALVPDTAPLKNPFKKIRVNKNRIKCIFAPSAGEKFKYTVVIEFKGVPYDTDDDTIPDDGRAVIRN